MANPISIHEHWETLAHEFTVDNILNQPRFIFILESPHVEEVKHRTPVAGSSGRLMTKMLIDGGVKTPFGLLVKNQQSDVVAANGQQIDMPAIGLMNVTPFPMQRLAYPHAVQQRHVPFFDLLEKLRVANNKDCFKEADLTQLQDLILDRFRQSLHPLAGRQSVVVPCGLFARKFFRLAQVQSDHWEILEDVPHPSMRCWFMPRYQAVIKSMKDRFMEVAGQS